MTRKRRQRGTGTVIEYIQRDGDVVYRVQFRDAAGVQLKETLGKKSEGWTRRKAEDELRERINHVVKKKYRRPDPVAFDSYAWRWFEEGQVPNDWKHSTVKTYRCAVKRLVEHFGNKRLGDIRRQHVNDLSADLQTRLAARTVNLTLTVLHSIMDRAVDEELLQANPASRVKRPREPRYKSRALTVDEARAVEGKIPDPSVRLAFITAEFVGLRWSEIRGLRWRDIDLLTKRLRVEDSKTPTGERSAAIPLPLAAEYERHFERTAYKHDEDWVFCHVERGTQANPEHYRQTVKDAATAAGVALFRPFHDMRVTSATSAVLTNEHPVKIMARHGWTNFETAKKYIDLAGQVFPDEAEALAAFRMGVPAES